jgi:hypothetical protein
MGRPPKLTAEEIQSLIEQRKQNITIKSLAEMYLISMPTVCKILKQAGLTKPRKVVNAN